MSEEINKAEEMKEVSAEARWYVVHTYSGYENKVKAINKIRDKAVESLKKEYGLGKKGVKRK